MKLLQYLFFLAAALSACTAPNQDLSKKTPTGDSTAKDTSGQTASVTDTAEYILKPIWGYRFHVSGDFDGDGKKEELLEHYYSRLYAKEVNKFFDDGSGYGMHVDSAVLRSPKSFVICSNSAFDTLLITDDEQHYGLSFLKNEGDLDGDGGDEISYVVNWADWSNLNTWHLMSYKKGKWKRLYSFGIWDWQLPGLPEAVNQYGLFGTSDKVIIAQDDTLNKRLEEELKSFPGLVKKLGRGRIRVIYRNEEAMEDTMVVDLRKVK